MYHHHSQQQGPPQPSSNRPGPTHHQQQPNQQQQQNLFNYPPPSHKLVSAMATRGSGDIDHCLTDLMNRPNPNQGSQPSPNQMSGTGGYSTNQLGHQQGMDWSNYPHTSQMFASPPSTVTQPQLQSSPSAMGNQAWMQAPAGDPPSPQTRGSHGGGNGSGGGVDKQALYTPEGAESILATLGLSNEDLEFLSQYPEDQLNPENLPFILRFIHRNKSESQDSAASSSYSQGASRAIHDMLPPPARPLSSTGRLRSPEVPRFHSVPQSAGNVIDYGHASQATDDSSGRESMPDRRHVRLQPFEPNEHVDLDYCWSGGEVHKNKRLSPAREFPPLYRSRHPDREYSRDGPKASPSSETWDDSSSSSRHVLKSHGTTKMLPTPTMMCDFSAESPKVYPHTCSLCEVDCEHAKDWIEHVKSVKHNDSCRDLRIKYPEWKHKLPRREHSLGQDDSQTTWHTKERSGSMSRSLSRSPTPSSLSGKRRIPSAFAFSSSAGHSRRERSPVKDGSQTTWHAKERSPTHSVSLSRSWSPSPSPPPPDKHRGGPHPQRQYGRSYQTPRHSYQRHHQATGSSCRDGLKRPRDASARHDDSARRKLPSSAKSPMKGKLKPGSKRTKPGRSKAEDTSDKGPSAKKMKRTPANTAACLLYLTGIPTTATEQEVKSWVRDFGKYNNVVLLSGSEEDQGQKASVCMNKEEDALALAQCSSLSIRDQPITVTLAKKPEADDSTAVSKGTSSQELSAIGGEDSGNGPELDKKTPEEECSSNSTVLVTGLPESGWTESDLIKLCQPFGAPTDIILARKLGKALLLLPDTEMAEEMVKNHSVSPMKINDFELQMTNLEQAVSIDAPVMLYKLLNPTVVVRWDRLLVIRNIPDTPTAYSDAQKLVERIGKIYNILVLNHNMIICEMLTNGAAVKIRNHYRKFPCIIQSNPLDFTSWRHPIHQDRVWGNLPPWQSASMDSLKESPDDDKDNHTVPTADKEDSSLPENEKCDYLEKLSHAGTVIGFHCKLCDNRIETRGALSRDLYHIDAHLNGKRHKMLLSLNEEYVEEVNKKVNLRRFYCHLCKCYINDLKSKLLHLKGRKHIGSLLEKNPVDNNRSRKVKKARLRDETDEKTSSKDEVSGKAASKEPRSKDEQVESEEEDEFQDFPDLLDFVTVDEVGEVNDFPGNPPPDAVAMDTTVMVDEESPADDKDSTPQENEKPVPREKKKAVKSSISVVRLNSFFHGDENLFQSVGEKSEMDEYSVEVTSRKGRLTFYCKVCKYKMDTKTHKRILELKRDFDAKKLKEAELRDDTDEKTSSKDEDQQDIKESPDNDKDRHTVLTPQQNGNDDYLVDICYDGTAIDFYCTLCEITLHNRNPIYVDTHLNGRRHNLLLSLMVIHGMDYHGKKRDKIEIFSQDECIVEVDGKSPDLFYCSVCKCKIKVQSEDKTINRDLHLMGTQHITSLCKKLKEGKLKDDADKKTSSKEEAAGKQPSKDKQDVEAGEELSNAVPTLVCNPEVDVKTAKIKMSLAIQPEERTSLPEDKTNSRPKKTKTSSSAAVDGDVSSRKPAHLELPKVESEEDQFQDFPFDMTDFVTVDEVGDVHGITGPPPDAVAMDTAATVEEAGDESDLPGCPPPPAVVSMDTSEAVVVKGTEEERESEAEATHVPEDTPQASPGPVTLAAAAPDKFESTAAASESPACVRSTLDPAVAAEPPHSPVPQAMCSSDQLDSPAPLPAEDSLPASAPATTASSPEGTTTTTSTPDVEACSSAVMPTAGGEQENPGPVSHGQAEEEETETVEQAEEDEDKERTAASVSAKRPIPEEEEEEEEAMQKKQKTHAPTADNPPPFDPNSAVGMEFLVPKKGFFCKLCNRFFTGGRESELNHCKSQKHHENWQKYLKSKKTTSR